MVRVVQSPLPIYIPTMGYQGYLSKQQLWCAATDSEGMVKNQPLLQGARRS